MLPLLLVSEEAVYVLFNSPSNSATLLSSTATSPLSSLYEYRFLICPATSATPAIFFTAKLVYASPTPTAPLPVPKLSPAATLTILLLLCPVMLILPSVSFLVSLSVPVSSSLTVSVYSFCFAVKLAPSSTTVKISLLPLTKLSIPFKTMPPLCVSPLGPTPALPTTETWSITLLPAILILPPVMLAPLFTATTVSVLKSE
ncbi:unknown [Phascolarctobacterium sp. CAG:266]|nr:unknown [Phascolarctobacterium sp. CAG:266]